MNGIEVLSPVGNREGFFASIQSGADAVYMGLPKFNARMKAENITLEDLKNLIKYAHLKGVKVYITMNTILKDNEIVEAVTMAGDCWQAGVDAFIVQDLGLISALKNAYPDIVLHGSTQLGVHNVLGAQVAKNLGLSRVVLSRECTLADIATIRKNVDIELEVFVQGANCICFSGNCYLSSIKCGASGNRGECKQLCRLPYTLSDGQKSVTGYTLSPRDNCLLDDLSELISLGVSSLKIEGRLRNLSYVKVATSVYRKAVDNICQGKKIDLEGGKKLLKRVFSRGEYVSGYNNGNNIIDIENNNHIGVKIGNVKKVSKFKDLYKIGIQLTSECVQNLGIDNADIIHPQDGLKFKTKNGIMSIGVGNVEYIDNIIYVYGKNYIDIGSTVYLAKDTMLENSISDLSRYRKVDITARVIANKPIYIKFSCGQYIEECDGEVVESAIKKAITSDTISEQLSKVDREIFEVGDVNILTDNAFVSLSRLNEIRRNLIEKIENKIVESERACNNFDKRNIGENANENVCKDNDFSPSAIAIVDEKSDILALKKDYECLMFSPTIYSVEVIREFLDKYNKYYNCPLIIDLPIIARSADIVIINDIVKTFGSGNIIFVANNIYGLAFAKDYQVWAGAGLNVVNRECIKVLKKMCVRKIIGSYEKWTSRCVDSYKISNFPLMTITSCPIKVLYNNECNVCKYSDNLKYVGDAFGLKVRRVKIRNCYFELFDNDYSCKNVKSNANVIDCRF